jgi:hypothetical protein
MLAWAFVGLAVIGGWLLLNDVRDRLAVRRRDRQRLDALCVAVDELRGSLTSLRTLVPKQSELYEDLLSWRTMASTRQAQRL